MSQVGGSGPDRLNATTVESFAFFASEGFTYGFFVMQFTVFESMLSSPCGLPLSIRKKARHPIAPALARTLRSKAGAAVFSVKDTGRIQRPVKMENPRPLGKGRGPVFPPSLRKL